MKVGIFVNLSHITVHYIYIMYCMLLFRVCVCVCMYIYTVYNQQFSVPFLLRLHHIFLTILRALLLLVLIILYVLYFSFRIHFPCPALYPGR